MALPQLMVETVIVQSLYNRKKQALKTMLALLFDYLYLSTYRPYQHYLLELLAQGYLLLVPL